MSGQHELLRSLPAVDRVLRADVLQDLVSRLPQEILTSSAQQAVADLRKRILAGAEVSAEQLDPVSVANAAVAFCQPYLQPSLRKVINATGTLLHTNLGRAPLSKEALDTIQTISEGYSTLEIDMDTGQRGHRYSHVRRLLTHLTGAEDALVVNNNAGAVLLALTALGKGSEAIVSRGELVEIGGAFRIPEVMEAGGLKLREVGSSNRTHLRDYEGAISEETKILLKVHTSNYRIIGFTSDVPAAELKPLAEKKNLILMEDLGSGMLIDLTKFGLPYEPTVAETVKAGVDVITFSGDKLLGGPQAGIVVGRKDLLQKIGKHPLARALRIDKLTLAALESTLRLYLQPEQVVERLPIMRMFNATPEEQQTRCQRLLDRLQAEGLPISLQLVEDFAQVGGGSMPQIQLPGWGVEIKPDTASVDALGRRLRNFIPAVVPRVQNDSLLINMRAVAEEEELLLAQLLIAAIRGEA
ncbi:L-seryl-tRNA(Sec) selenium transferase [Malonomonas rubra DSM 5091]|uniref:L-seryl-tRNA(Sec) selenium transferase n=1 Tax=Malonomonas rubra DSM 5091 TaxID=1122189 RepID=A0A1M6C1T1_MALRU|nr:L-seryl-tRNA(Sec) selenium transferase [Malonomonas rubra]SHI54977.1 L-seryl-tRNA(Sec) selenium transferase [Malonomonas rubra DSM 5091]